MFDSNRDLIIYKHLYTSDCLVRTLANSEEPDEMPMNAVFNRSYCLIKQKQSSEKDIHTCDRECSGSVVECLTRDRGAAGGSLTGVTAFCP